MAQADDELSKYIVELQILEKASETLQARIGLVNASISELRMANTTMEGLKNEETGAIILVPIGGGSYLKTKIEDAERLIVGIGAEVAVEKTLREAQEDVGTRILELEKARTNLQQQLEQALSRMDAVKSKIQEITQRASKGKR